MNHLSPSEQLARFIFSRKLYSPAKAEVKYAAFMPRRRSETSVLEVPVSRISGLPEVEIWTIGEQVGQQSGRTLRARADISVSMVYARELHVDPDEPPPRHANITGWPETESEQELIAIELAAGALLRVK